MAPNAKWSAPEKQRVIEQYKAGVRASDIARTINLEFYDYRQVRTTYSVTSLLNTMKNAGELVRDEKMTYWSDDELLYLQKLYTEKSGLSYQVIADRLNEKFHEKKKKRTVKSLSYGIELIYQRGLDPLLYSRK